MGRPLADATARFSGVVAGPQTSGEAEIAATLGDDAGQRLGEALGRRDGARVLEDLIFSVGESRAAGDLTLGADGLLAGDAQRRVARSLQGRAALPRRRRAACCAPTSRFRPRAARSRRRSPARRPTSSTRTSRSNPPTSRATARDLFRAPQIEGNFSLRNLTAGGLTILTATGTAARQGESTALSVDAQLADGSAKLAGQPCAAAMAGSRSRCRASPIRARASIWRLPRRRRSSVKRRHRALRQDDAEDRRRQRRASPGRPARPSISLRR